MSQVSTEVSQPSRREFVTIAAGVAGAACACAICPGTAAFGQNAPPATAPAGPVKVGPLSAFATDGAVNTWAKPNGFFVVRQGDKLYAPSSICSHRRAALAVDNTQFKCASHGSLFSLDGKVTKGPAKVNLPRFAISVDAEKNVTVDTSKPFEEANWTDPASFVQIPAA
jgi:nitrite reductase/ring-hydroxylating ferredoxin subunit